MDSILDTTAYSALDRGDTAVVNFLAGARSLVLPLPAIGELRYGFVGGTKQEENESRLERFLGQDNTNIVFPSLRTTHHFAELKLVCKKARRVLSHNDLWIAALAQEYGLTLVTLDKDFDVFKDLFGDQLYILE